MSDPGTQILRLLDAIGPGPRGGFCWFGQEFGGLTPEAWGRLPAADRWRYREHALAEHLYRHFYCSGGAVPLLFRDVTGTRLAVNTAPLAPRTAPPRWEPGWVVAAAAGTGWRVARAGVAIVVEPSDFQTDDGDITVGRAGRVAMPAAFGNMSPGFLLTIGRAEPPAGPTVRVYLNVAPCSGPAIAAAIAPRLDKAGVGFRFKYSTDGDTSRCDTFVLYVTRSDWPTVRAVLPAALARTREQLGATVPALTKRLARGVGLAEQPPAAASFGVHRSTLLARGIVNGHRRRLRRRDARMAEIEAVFALEGLDLSAPHLNPGSDDWYSPLDCVAQPRRSRSQPVEVGADRLVEVAARVAHHIAGAAITDGRRATWCSPYLEESRRVQRVVGPEVYSGAAGIGLFLAEAAAATGDGALRRLASSAFDHALATADVVPPEHRMGLVAGWTGIAVSCLDGMHLLNDDSLASRAQTLATGLFVSPLDGPFDLMSGHAGAIIGAVTLHMRHAIPGALDYAVRVADDLLGQARRTPTGWSWRTVNRAGDHDLTGLSHGAAGIGLALLELHAATGDAAYDTASQRAFGYEASVFDPVAGGWPDLRKIRSHRRPPTFPVARVWCHGAGGIALSRLRAIELSGPRPELTKALHAAVSLLRDGVAQDLDEGRANFSLCHGLAGNALALHEVAPVADDGGATNRTAAAVFATGAAAYGHDPLSWPCAAGGSSPGLMLGLSGIGHAYLQRAGCRVADVLLHRPTPLRRA